MCLRASYARSFSLEITMLDTVRGVIIKHYRDLNNSSSFMISLELTQRRHEARGMSDVITGRFT